MIENRRVLVAVIALALVGVLSLYAYSASIGPDRMGIGDLGPNDVGRYVSLQGTVSSPRALSSGAVMLALVDTSTGDSITVFLEEQAVSELDDNSSLLPGARVELSGTVEEYDEGLELRVASAGGIRLLEGAGETLVPLAELMASPQLFDGMEISTSGEAYNIHTGWGSTDLTLQDISGGYTYSLQCSIDGWDWSSDDSGIVESSQVRVTGELRYVSTMARWELVGDGPEAISPI